MQEALAAFRRNEFVLVMDADDREDECDLIIAAENITTAQMAFLIRYGTGIACVVADKQRLEISGYILPPPPTPT
jgi:3,4-dihydroxy-2-butanone 4-phosphate synthase